MSRIVLPKCRYLLALDPSGSFYEGKGTTGWCVFDTKKNLFIACGSLFAKNYRCAEAYWEDVINIIRLYRKHYGKQLMLVCEDYLLYASKLEDQINSRMETCKLIGAIQLYCHQHGICYYMQTAAEVKKRWENKILLYKGYIKPYRRGYIPTSGACEAYTHHTLDAIRHAIHYATFKNGR